MNRSRVVKVRVTESEYSNWVQMAAKGNLSLSETIRRAMGAGSRPEPKKPAESLRAPRGHYGANYPNAKITYSKLNLGAPTFGFVGPPDQPVGPGRRSIPCSHGKPPYAFCPECDG